MWNWLQTQLFGVDPAAEQARQASLDAQIAAQNQSAWDTGLWTEDQYNAAMNNLAKSDTPDIQGSINNAFVEGAQEGLASLGSNIQSTFNTVTGGVFKLVPWQIWVVLGVLLFIWLGGIAWSKGILDKKK